MEDCWDDIQDPEDEQEVDLEEEQGDREDEVEEELINQTNNLKIDEEILSPGTEHQIQEEDIFFSYCVCNDLEVLKELLETSSDATRLINRKDERGNSALALACMEGHQNVVRLLHKRGADIESVNMQRRTPLMEALYYGHGAIAEYLVSEGASTSVKDEEGTSILDVAKRTVNKLEDVEWMLSRVETETRARYLERKSNKEKIRKIIDLCKPVTTVARIQKGG